MTVPVRTERVSAGSATAHPGLALVVIAAAQLMVVLDGTITNIALPSIQEDLEVSASGLSWIVNSYVLAFGGLLLLGGRAGDLYGRRRVFRVGLVVFSFASLLGGLAPNAELLIAARVLQGLGAAVIAPTALSLIATTFAEGAPRNRAMGVYAAMSGIGSTVGLLLGGVLTDYLSWRWVMFVNVPIGLAVLIGTRVVASGEKSHGELDVRGAVLGTGGLVALVYAITQGGDRGWNDNVTIGMFVIAAVLLAVFLRTQRRNSHPILPLRLLRDRNRAGSYATMLLIGAAMFATFYFLSLYLQQVHGYSPVRAGFAYLPFSLGMGLSAGLGSRLVGRFPPRAIAAPGLVLAAGGMLWFSLLEPSSSYATHLMPAMFVTAVGLGASFLPMTLGAVSGVTSTDAGIASAVLNTTQQIGGAVGLAVLATLSTSAADDQLPHADGAFFQGVATGDRGLIQQASDALTHGYTVAFAAASGLLIIALVITLTALNAKAQHGAKAASAVHMG
ncbi:MFS transporter [Micromonospora sp. WMMD980]|uniref:MFS transporter n=1 Tax=Micromonospora sp. WMMD980 TaxID=3016088 RepID=UPI0024171916|nr:MFS transporter [Micromonospora sp. WMMD980]MDG4800113.1 MFS transporter [Micromonospora sp. WMMD980]